ncbi:unnamed protein product, partial [Durusdinium trenchii]
ALPSPREAPEEPELDKPELDKEEWISGLVALDREAAALAEELATWHRGWARGERCAAELAACADEGGEESRRWTETLWMGLSEIRCQVRSFDRWSSKALELRIDAYKARQSEHFETLADAQESLEVAIQKLECLQCFEPRGFEPLEPLEPLPSAPNNGVQHSVRKAPVKEDAELQELKAELLKLDEAPGGTGGWRASRHEA